MKNVLTIVWCILSLNLVAQVPGSNVFNDSFLHEIRFENADTAYWIASENYQRLNMRIDGTLVDSVGFKRKGNISEYPSTNKYGIKIKTNKYVQGKYYDGIKEFTLHMNFQDPTMMREKLTYDICNEMGLFSLRTAFAKVYINNVYWGLYTIVEGKDEMYKHKFGNRSSDAIESLDFGDMCYYGTDIWEYDASHPSSIYPRYEFSNGDPNTAWSSFINMLNKANNTSIAQYLDTVPKYLNIEDFFKYQAVNVYLMNFDSYISLRGNQIYVFDSLVKKWQVTPWDFNASFGLWQTNNYHVTTYPMIPTVISSGCIASKMNALPQLKNYYLEAMCRLANVVCDTNVMFSKINNWKSQIKQAVYDDYRKVASNSDFDNGLEYGYHNVYGLADVPALKTVLSERYNLIHQGLINAGFNCIVGIDDEVSEDGNITIYPNPSSDFITILAKNIPIKNVKIIDLTGKLIYENTFIEMVNVSNLKTGMYVIQIESKDGKQIVHKFIKE
ncbi:MAG: CotH kinase family protein [Flavobacteriales bacterium]|nr:CotH kinase family protein [Flavobacteriales bacterium]